MPAVVQWSRRKTGTMGTRWRAKRKLGVWVKASWALLRFPGVSPRNAIHIYSSTAVAEYKNLHITHINETYN